MGVPKTKVWRIFKNKGLGDLLKRERYGESKALHFERLCGSDRLLVGHEQEEPVQVVKLIIAT